jgi:HNH endonuclease
VDVSVLRRQDNLHARLGPAQRGFPNDFPYHPNWKGGLTHPAVIARSAVIDHIEPGSLEGDWLDEENLVAACWPCNVRKGDLTLEQLGWELAPPTTVPWDGLTTRYFDLWVAAGRPEAGGHRRWLRAFEQASAF